MTMSSDLNLMDFLFDRDDPLQLLEKDSYVKSEVMDSWQNSTDEFLDSILKFDDIINPFEMLDDSKTFSVSDAVDMSLTTSSSSESGLSIDQQLSPMLDADDEDAGDYLLTSSGSEGSPNPNFYASIDSPKNEEEIEIDSSVFDISDTHNFGDIIIEDDQDVIALCDEQSKETVQTHNVKSNSIHKLIKVSGNPRSILLPHSLKNMKDVRAIKIFNTVLTKSGLKNLSKISVPLPVESTASSCSSKSSMMSSEDESDSQYPRLQLTTEEKRLLQKEGVRLPSHYPLTKFEERELKRIRRKIRNKISAQDSRKRKKEYIDGLEDRVKQCTEENINLVKKIKVLQSQNQTMMTQLKRLHAALSRGGAKTAQPATCLMVLMLSMALVMMPNLGANQKADMQAETEITLPEKDGSPIAGRSRTLLFSKPPVEEGLCLPSDIEMEENMLNELEDSLHFHNDLDDHNYGPPPSKISRKSPVEYLPGSKGFIVPPIDDAWPPSNPFDLGKNNEINNKIEEYVKEFKVNISDANGRPSRTVVVQIPTEK